MFRLVKILNGRINVSEPLVMQVSALQAEIAEGTPVAIANGACSAATGDVAVEYVTAAKAEKGATAVAVLLVTRDMIFEVDAISGAKVGNKYQITSTGVGTTAATNAGATVIETTTDYALVRLA